MKKIKFMAALFGLMLLCAGCTTQKFKGKAKANSSHFEMEYSVFTGTKDVTMNLREGEALSIDVETKKGMQKTRMLSTPEKNRNRSGTWSNEKILPA